MRLTKIRVTNFRSVEDSGTFDVGSTLCLVGKNEAGKTAVLQALAGLNPHPATPITFNVERDYPRRHLTNYKERHSGEEAVVITTEWELTTEQRAAIADSFGEKAVLSTPLIILRRYNAAAPEWTVPIDFKCAIEYLIDDEHLSAQDRKPHSAQQAS
jgi:predicted ATP-dependent endonuclease of OLD family